jgi:hypothetical protein
VNGVSPDKNHLRIDQLAETLDAEARKSYPPVHLWDPANVGEIDIRIAADGTWYHEGDPILRPALVRLFSTVLRKDDDGRHYLVTPAERLAIEVDVAPLYVSEMYREGEGDDQTLVFRTHTGDVAPLDEAHPLRVPVDPETGEPTPLVLVRDRLEGILARSVFYDLVDIAEEREIDGVAVQGVMSAGRFHVIGRSDGRPLD